jgi:WD40 repeat protein
LPGHLIKDALLREVVIKRCKSGIVLLEKTLLTYRGHHEAVNAVAWSPDGMHIASGGVVLHIWDSFSGENDYSPDSAGDVVNTLAWSPDGIHIAVAIDEVNTAYISPRDQMNIQAMVKILLVP